MFGRVLNKVTNGVKTKTSKVKNLYNGPLSSIDMGADDNIYKDLQSNKSEKKLRNLSRPLTLEEDLFLKLRNHCECGVTFQNSYFIELLLTDGYVDFNEQENSSIRATLESRKKLIRFYKYEPIFGLQLKKGLLDDFELFEEVYFEAIPPDPDKIYAIVFKQNGTEGHLHSEGWRWVERILDEGHDTLCTGMKYLDLEECQNNFSRNDTMLLRKTIAKEDLVEIYAIHPNEHYFERLR